MKHGDWTIDYPAARQSMPDALWLQIGFFMMTDGL